MKACQLTRTKLPQKKTFRISFTFKNLQQIKSTASKVEPEFWKIIFAASLTSKQRMMENKKRPLTFFCFSSNWRFYNICTRGVGDRGVIFWNFLKIKMLKKNHTATCKIFSQIFFSPKKLKDPSPHPRNPSKILLSFIYDINSD
jgi:hypothetical protein